MILGRFDNIGPRLKKTIETLNYVEMEHLHQTREHLLKEKAQYS